MRCMHSLPPCRQHIGHCSEPLRCMQVAVRWPGGGADVQIAISMGGVQRNMNRAPDEPLSKCLARLRANLAPKGESVSFMLSRFASS